MDTIHGRMREAEAARIRLESALKEWLDKTEWVQANCQSKDLGRHRADVINDRISELEDALKRMVAIHMPLTGNPTRAELVEFWSYEKSQGRGEADDMLFVMRVLSRAKS